MAHDLTRGPHALDVAIGFRLRERRRALGMSQQDLAEAVGITFQQIQKYERGANRVSFSRLLELAHALRCRLDDLADGLQAGGDDAPTERLNALVNRHGALQLLEAYDALPTAALRRALLQHARALSQALAVREDRET